MYNERDLRPFPFDEKLLRLLERIRRTSLIALLKTWFDSNQLRPVRPNSNFSDYAEENPRKSKLEIIRMMQLDWPRGLCACQIAQLHFDKITGMRRFFWRAIKLANEEENIKLHLDRQAISDEIEKYMKEFFYCYVYSFLHEETNSFMFVLCVSPESDNSVAYSNQLFSYMIYFPETEYAVTPKYVWSMELDGYFKEALLSAFGATKLLTETTDVESIAELKRTIDHKNSKGILAQLRKNTLDTTPLDIRQKRQREFDEYYVNAGEQRKRIIPIDMEEMKARYQALEDNFGWEEVEGSTSLEVDLELPLNTGKENSLVDYDDDIVEISMLIEGTNVAEGVRKSIISGKIDTPAPLWLEAIAVTDLKKIKVHPDGVVENLLAEKVEEERSTP